MQKQSASLIEKSYKMRKRYLEIFTDLGIGHVTSAFSTTEILVTLYYTIMRYQTDNAEWEDRDRFVLSKGHGAGMLFPIFEDLNFLPSDKLKESMQIGGDLSVLRSFFYPGFEFYGGSLGIGLGLACGLAKGARLNRRDWLTFCLVGDAECYEGAIWEAAMFAGHQHLNNLVAIVDRNYLGCSDFTENMLSLEPFADKWRACDWDTAEVDGHDCQAIYTVLRDIRSRHSKKPLCIIANTIKGHGLSYMENIPLMHGHIPSGEETKRAFQELEQWRQFNLPTEERL